MSKITQLKQKLERAEIEAAVLSDPISISYLTEFYSDPHERLMLLFLFQEESLLFLPELEVARAKNFLSLPIVGYSDSENPWAKLKTILSKTDFSKIALEYDHLNISKYQGLKSLLSGQFTDLTPFLDRMRLIKSPDEIQKLTAAGNLADKAVQIGFDHISLDTTETDIIAQIEFEMRKQGVDKMSFDTLVLTGKKAADPHGLPSTKRLENNSLLLFDLGVQTLGYTSDMTRTVALGQPSQFKKDIYSLCLEAQLTALNFIKPGVTAAQVDAAARSVIEKAGYGDYFNHRLGHGIGMSVHEFPSITATNDIVLEEGMCFSVEPGIYIPEKVGVRIEDCGHVTKQGFQTFTKTSKELLYF
ncbi:M24 family metallopeptidase [Streptococcus macacae]|uniref:Metallopeptidase family M24 n=1 Tax=Streptococcus macacae NCTC 11558 TaxID=764298 RepID=G5JYJ8_9STRE|nr:Xaa-Pro peptidase family protein [Streptococcus macacae]EHJ52711.1 metallopeptidase family M24 [Streptococcus macacae NCTC 11558]SUN78111.1 dipeptidase [Streptococcus macacae NCTC 11558]